jgi:thermitase
VLNAPGNLVADVSGSSVTLTWSDNSAGEDGFYVERGVKVKGRIAFSRVGQVDADVTTFSEDVANGAYRYRVQAFRLDTGAVSGYSNVAQAEVGRKGGGGGKKNR